jgi:hypothetical protein
MGERQKIGVPGHDQISSAVDRQLEEFVVRRVTTGRNRSVIVTVSADANSFLNQAAATGEISGAR